MKFVKEFRRSTMSEMPLMPGAAVLAIKESEEGKPFSELIDEFLNSESVADIQKKNDVLALRYGMTVDLSSEPSDEDLQELRVGLGKLDEASSQYRKSIAKTELETVKAQSQRINCNIHVIGLFNCVDFVQEFDYCNVDLSKLSDDEIEKNLVYLAGLAQRPNPTVYTISADLANRLETKEMKETALGKTLEAKIKLKSVFAPSDGLNNIFVRSI